MGKGKYKMCVKLINKAVFTELPKVKITRLLHIEGFLTACLDSSCTFIFKVCNHKSENIYITMKHRWELSAPSCIYYEYDLHTIIA